VCDVMEMCVSTTAVLLYYAKTVLKYFKNHIIKWLWLRAGPEINANIRVAHPCGSDGATYRM